MDYIAHWNGKDQFEIEASTLKRYKVHLTERNYSFRRWQLTGIPCPHAISALYYLNCEPENHVHDYYKKETFINAYSNLLPTLNSCDMWPKLDLQPLIPPIAERLSGRPKKNDRKKENERIYVKQDKMRLGKKGVIMTCSICQKLNHNSRGCYLNKRSSLDIPAPLYNTADEVSQSVSPIKKVRSNERDDTIALPPRVTRSRAHMTSTPEVAVNTRETRSVEMRSTTSPSRITRSCWNISTKLLEYFNHQLSLLHAKEADQRSL